MEEWAHTLKQGQEGREEVEEGDGRGYGNHRSFDSFVVQCAIEKALEVGASLPALHPPLIIFSSYLNFIA